MAFRAHEQIVSVFAVEGLSSNLVCLLWGYLMAILHYGYFCHLYQPETGIQLSFFVSTADKGFLWKLAKSLAYFLNPAQNSADRF